jgi:hypothetical protein
MRSSICSDVSSSPKAGMICENPREGPPWTMTSFHAEFGSGVVWSHLVKSGKVSGRSNPAMVWGVPLPSAPWQATHPLLKICFPSPGSGGFGYLSVCASNTAEGKKQNAIRAATAVRVLQSSRIFCSTAFKNMPFILMHHEPLTNSLLRGSGIQPKGAPVFHEIATQKSANPAQMETRSDAEETTLTPRELEDRKGLEYGGGGRTRTSDLRTGMRSVPENDVETDRSRTDWKT